MTDPLLAERAAVVTGAGQGIGCETARSLRAYGANVVRTAMSAVVFLASDLASYITGTVIEVGGGRYI